MKTRNEGAVCENCPYWDNEDTPDDYGACCATHPFASKDRLEGYNSLYRAAHVVTLAFCWCGKHPNFFMEEETEHADSD